MHPPHGPHRISKNGQIVLPKEVLQAARLESGDAVYVIVIEDPPGSILVVPMEVATRWFELGRQADQANDPEATL